MTDKISKSQLRKIVFNNIDENHNGKIDSTETKMGAIFGLKEGDSKIKRKNFDRNVAINFMNARNEGKDVQYRIKVTGDAAIENCYKCNITEKDIGVDINGNDNTTIVQHGDNHRMVLEGDQIDASTPVAEDNSETQDIGLCIECDVEMTNDKIDINGRGNTLLYQNENKNVLIVNNEEDVHIGGKNNVEIDECQDCNKEETNSHVTIIGDSNDTIYQSGNKNKANKK